MGPTVAACGRTCFQRRRRFRSTRLPTACLEGVGQHHRAGGYIDRSGFGVTATGPRSTCRPSPVGVHARRVLQDAGVVRGMELDINPAG